MLLVALQRIYTSRNPGMWRENEKKNGRGEEEINAEGKREKEKKNIRRGNEATLSDPLIAGRFLRASSFQLAPGDLRLCIREHLVGRRVLEILEIHSRRIESRLADNAVANERYLRRHPCHPLAERPTLSRFFITHVDSLTEIL